MQGVAHTQGSPIRQGAIHPALGKKSGFSTGLLKIINFMIRVWHLITCNYFKTEKVSVAAPHEKPTSIEPSSPTESPGLSPAIPSIENAQQVGGIGFATLPVGVARRTKDPLDPLHSRDSGAGEGESLGSTKKASVLKQSKSLLEHLEQGADGLHGENNDFKLPLCLGKEMSDPEKERAALTFLGYLRCIVFPLDMRKKIEMRPNNEMGVILKPKYRSKEERFLSTISQNLNEEIGSIFRPLLSLYEVGVITSFTYAQITRSIELCLKHAIKVYVPKKEGDGTRNGAVISFGPIVKMRIENDEKKLFFDEGFSLTCRPDRWFFTNDICPKIKFIKYKDVNRVDLCAGYLITDETTTHVISELTKQWGDKSQIRQ
jgi:hypothetical protein